MQFLRVIFGFFQFLLLFEKFYSYNLDTTHPIIISNFADGTDSYFGTTVELAHEDDGIGWIIVGAPRANSSYSNHQTIFEPGVIYRCSFGKTSNDSCEIVMMDPTREDDVKESFTVKDKKDGGWLGGSMMVGDSTRFVACANRWSNQKFANKPNRGDQDEYLLHGICYWRHKKDVCQEVLPDLPANYRLLPLSSIDDLDKQGGNYKAYWTYGQSGFSMHLTSENKLILGAPGIDAWKGSVIEYSDRGQPLIDRDIFAIPLVVRPELSSFLDKEGYFGYAVTSGKFIMPTDDSPDRKIQYVSGAPRGSRLFGKVVIFNFPRNVNESLESLNIIEGKQIGSYFGSVLCVVDLNNDGYDDLIIGAPRFSTKRHNSKLPTFSSFGTFTGESSQIPSSTSPSAATAIDDSEFEKSPDDILYLLPTDVPFEKLGNRGDEGAVFIYISTGEFPLELKETINGDNEPWSQFGSSIASPGDLNQDGFNDLIIGAPYSQKGKGAIYIYHGDSKGINNKYAQVIYASQIDSSLRGFGFSVSRGLDIDNNGYNDVAVGSYESAQTVIFKARPAVKITGRIHAEVDRLPLNATKFSVFSCVTYTGFKLPRSLDIGARVFSDVDSKPPRILLQKPELDGSTFREQTYEEIAYYGLATCTKLIAVVVRPLNSDQPIKFRQQVFLPEKDFTGNRGKRSPQQSHATHYDIRINPETRRSFTHIHGKGLTEFCSTCPIMDAQLENTTSFSLPLEVLCGEDDKCVADLQIEATFLNIPPGNNFTIGSASSLVLQVSVTNYKETAMSPAVIISFSRRNLIRVPPACESIQSSTALFYSYKCSLGRTLDKDHVADISMEFDMSDLVVGSQAFEQEYLFTVEATTLSELEQRSVVSLILPVNASADVHIKGNKYNILYSKTTLSKHQILSHIYQIRLYGESTISNMWLNFHVPVNLTHARGSMEVVEVYYPRAEVDGNEMECQRVGGGVFQNDSAETSVGQTRVLHGGIGASDSSFDAVMIQSSVSKEYSESEIGRDLRRKRQANHPSQSQSALSSNRFLRENLLFFDCNTQMVECMEISCKLRNFKSTSRGSVTITMRIGSNVTRKLFDQYDANSLVIQTHGEIILKNIDPGVQGLNLYSDKSEASTTILLDAPKKVSRWIIMGSIVGGLLIFICIALCLYACGFLERKKKPVENAEDEDEEGIQEEDEEEEEGEEDTPISPKLETIEENEEEQSS